MFTGIVEEVGRVVAVEHGTTSSVLRLEGPLVVSDATHGASIAVDGVCLTVVEHDERTFSVDVMTTTLECTSLGRVQVGSRVNLERAMAADGRFGGHIVAGHVDATVALRSRTPGDRWEILEFELPAALARYVVTKGSIALDGVSLTVASVAADSFTVSLIPTTLAETTLGALAVGDVVNVEVDMLAKYVERMLEGRG
ncbi:MAG: riboflavin synthase [Mobilicoccus sp.]|nr:riboflavin synthase [Mobilicoccus sp.]